MLARVGLIILVSSLSCAVLPVVAEALGLPLWSGIGAGLAGALFPMHRSAETFNAWDEPYGALGLMVVLGLLSQWPALRAGRLPALAVYGMLWGLLLHVTAPFLIVQLGLGVSEVVAQRWQGGLGIRRWLVVVVFAGVVMIPWTVRNRVKLGGWIFMRSNLGIELDLANNDRSGPSMADNVKTGFGFHPNGSVAEALRIRSIGEIGYNRERLSRAFKWIQGHPSRFVALTIARARMFWLGWWGDRATAWVFTLATALAVVGCWFLWRTGNYGPLRLIGVVWLFYPLTYYVVQYVPRYRIPIWWTVLLMAGYGAGQIVKTLRVLRMRRPFGAAQHNPVAAAFD